MEVPTEDPIVLLYQTPRSLRKTVQEERRGINVGIDGFHTCTAQVPEPLVNPKPFQRTFGREVVR